MGAPWSVIRSLTELEPEKRGNVPSRVLELAQRAVLELAFLNVWRLRSGRDYRCRRDPFWSDASQKVHRTSWPDAERCPSNRSGCAHIGPLCLHEPRAAGGAQWFNDTSSFAFAGGSMLRVVSMHGEVAAATSGLD